MRQMRRIEFTETAGRPKVKGYFHQWGLGTEDNGISMHNVTMGVVENEKGQVYMVYPTLITFLD